MLQSKRKEYPSVVREYTIGDTKYIVKASVKEGATEDAATKIRRLIRNDIGKQDAHKS